MQKLILGTASFGSTPYGIKGDGLVSEQELERIARIAWDEGIRVIHTSRQYKLPKIAYAIFSEFDVIEKLDDPQFFAYKGKICGISVYDYVDFASFLINRICDSKIIQCPINILDSRFINTLRNAGNPWKQKIHARSVFLQGLLLMDMKDLPLWVNGEAFKQIYRFHETCQRINVKLYEACLGYVLGLEEIDHVIVGVNSAKQLEQLLAVKPMIWEYDFSVEDENILDPRRWPK